TFRQPWFASSIDVWRRIPPRVFSRRETSPLRSKARRRTPSLRSRRCPGFPCYENVSGSPRPLALAAEHARSPSESLIPGVSRIPLLQKREWLAWPLAAAAILAAITLWLVSRMNPAPVVGGGHLGRLPRKPHAH